LPGSLRAAKAGTGEIVVHQRILCRGRGAEHAAQTWSGIMTHAWTRFARNASWFPTPAKSGGIDPKPVSTNRSDTTA